MWYTLMASEDILVFLWKQMIINWGWKKRIEQVKKSISPSPNKGKISYFFHILHLSVSRVLDDQISNLIPSTLHTSSTSKLLLIMNGPIKFLFNHDLYPTTISRKKKFKKRQAPTYIIMIPHIIIHLIISNCVNSSQPAITRPHFCAAAAARTP